MNDLPPNYNNGGSVPNDEVPVQQPIGHYIPEDTIQYVIPNEQTVAPVTEGSDPVITEPVNKGLVGHPHPTLQGAKPVLSKEKGLFKVLSPSLISKYQELLDAVLTEEERAELIEYNNKFAKLVKSGKTDEEATAMLVLPVDKEKIQRYTEISESADILLTHKDVLDVYENSGDVYHGIEDDEGNLVAQVSPKTKAVESITTAKQLLAALTTAGFKSTRHLPCFGSGIRLDISTPDDTALMSCMERSNDAKTNYGNDTAGYYFSTDMVFTLTSLARLAFQNTYACNIKGLADLDTEQRVEKLMALTPITEINHLLQGLGYTLHPKGFPVDVICTNPKCGVETTYNQNVGHMAYHFQSKLPTDLVRRMRKFRNVIEEAEVLKYREDMVANIPSRTLRIELENENHITVVFKIPSIADYEKSSIYWIESIVASIDQIIGESYVTEMDRERRIASRIEYETLNRYIPYIDKINIGESVIDSSLIDEDNLRNALASLSSYTDLQEKLVNGVLAFIADATPTVIGMALPVCPACNTSSENTSIHSDSLMVVDPVNFFLALRALKLSRGRNIMKQKVQNS